MSKQKPVELPVPPPTNAIQPGLPRTHETVGVMLQAVQSGAKGDDLQAIMDMIRFADQREAENAFNAAFVAAQSEMPTVYKGGIVDFATDKGRTHYQYERLEDVINAVGPVLKKHGLAFRHRVKTVDGVMHVQCVICHELGHSEETTLLAGPDKSGNKNAIQAVGSALTYLKRHTLKAALGIATTDDDDATAWGAQEIVETVDAEHLAHINDAIDSMNADQADILRARIKSAYMISDLERLPAAKYPDVMRRIDKYRKAVGA